MQCAFCKETIDDNSFYCDMCGEELKACPSCKKPGKGKVCTSCGTPLTTLKSQAEASDGSGKASQEEPPPPKDEKAADPSGSVDSTYRLPEDEPPKPAVPELRLLNKNINADLKIDENTIIGRTTGQFASIFGSYNQVSSKHCRFNYDPAKGWSVTDLGSTNKTKLNNQPLAPNTPQALADQTFLKIANIEFFVRIIPG